ncbi:phosphoenolpyruvate--protein phosphotransferase [Sphingorhabdus lutea]|uniref:phosphoenolpyruvate--protein phosphotransferase n=1 Tax=Sphingorhabdus lutea TaxID=1913578 RepID=A0A1L3JBA0_9SPHN|nr:phosphoenolpyruvate--protein phosphotransferase [Sphingorhabdus lutea]APG62414.1 phosphoenolpyruvate--protein phosphotransferase [Sphingorhabdus lutea]
MNIVSQSSRTILTNLHDLMASKRGAQTKLNMIVDIIGETLQSEVCSIYLRREGMLELFATRGLNQEAVHVTRLALGEGLVGSIAKDVETLNLDEAATHPRFAYKPETGEEKFHSFAGVPIIRAERAVGVLSVQHAEPRKYEDVEIETLQTVAMVMSELIAGAGLIDGSDDAQMDQSTAVANGLPLVKGVALGKAIFHEPNIRIEHVLAEDVEVERQRVYTAFTKMRDQIEQLANQAEFGNAGEHVEIFAAYKMFAYDEGWSRRINKAIDSGLTAEAAIEHVQQRTRMRMRQIDDPLLAERMHDLEDLSNRLLRIVSGQMSTAAQLGLNEDSILVARNLGPAELLEYDRRRLRGVILEEGSLTAHVTIVARAMGIPVLGRIGSIRGQIRENDMLLLNVDQKNVIIRPSGAAIEAFQHELDLKKEQKAKFASMRNIEPISIDGTRINLMINAGLRDDVSSITTTGADGIGLFRTEFQFLVSATLPRREQQIRFYRDVLDVAGNKPVIFRTIDVGGDKALPYLQNRGQDEENPAMGWRAVRLALDHGGLMKAQAQSLLEASPGKLLQVMFPMIAEPWEFDEAKQVFDDQLALLKKRGKQPPSKIRYGVMLEVPALADMLDILLPKVDFISIGTNDLTQFLFAADRAHPRLAERYDWLSLAIMRFLNRVVKECIAHDVDVSICGEMGGRRLEALALLGIGVRKLSITPAAIGSIKSLVISTDIPKIEAKMQELLKSPCPNLRPELEKWAEEHGVDLD